MTNDSPVWSRRLIHRIVLTAAKLILTATLAQSQKASRQAVRRGFGPSYGQIRRLSPFRGLGGQISILSRTTSGRNGYRRRKKPS